MPFCQITLKAQRPLSPQYPKELKALGDHIRKKRLDLGLLQKELAQRLGVAETTLYTWENNRATPSLSIIPDIIKFLGYVPFSCPDDPIEKLRYFKLINGLSYKRLGELMARDHEQLAEWSDKTL